MKPVAVCFLLAVLAAVSVEGYRYYNQSRIIGFVSPGDRLLDHESLYKPGRVNQVVVSNYKYPKYGPGFRINCIKVLDRDLSGYNGDLYMNSGGVGQTHVSMSIRSKMSYGNKYDVEIWGR